MNDEGEMAVPAGVSMSTGRLADPAEAVTTAGASVASVKAAGPTGFAVLTGDQITSAPAFVAPTLVRWGAAISHGGGQSLVTFQAPTETAGALCRVEFQLKFGARPETAAATSASTPEQNAPHTQQIIVTNALMWGQYCQLWWRWFSGATASAFMNTGFVVYVPTFGDPDSIEGN